MLIQANTETVTLKSVSAPRKVESASGNEFTFYEATFALSNGGLATLTFSADDHKKLEKMKAGDPVTIAVQVVDGKTFYNVR